MTIQQHASFDSSAAELNATSKLVKAWESKNAKNAARAGGVSLLALSLAACGGSSETVTTPVDIKSDNVEAILEAVTAVDAGALTVQEVADRAKEVGGKLEAQETVDYVNAALSTNFTIDTDIDTVLGAVAESDNDSEISAALRDAAAGLGVTGTSVMSNAELITAIKTANDDAVKVSDNTEVMISNAELAAEEAEALTAGLKAAAVDLGVTGTSAMSNAELITAIKTANDAGVMVSDNTAVMISEAELATEKAEALTAGLKAAAVDLGVTGTSAMSNAELITAIKTVNDAAVKVSDNTEVMISEAELAIRVAADNDTSTNTAVSDATAFGTLAELIEAYNNLVNPTTVSEYTVSAVDLVSANATAGGVATVLFVGSPTSATVTVESTGITYTDLILSTGATNTTIVAGDQVGAGDTITVVGSGNNTITLGAGNDTLVVYGDGNNSVNAGTGNDSITTGAGNDSITIGSGDLGEGDFVTAGTGTDTVTISGDGNVIALNAAGTGAVLSGVENLVLDGTSATIHAGALEGLSSVSGSITTSKITVAMSNHVDSNGATTTDLDLSSTDLTGVESLTVDGTANLILTATQIGQIGAITSNAGVSITVTTSMAGLEAIGSKAEAGSGGTVSYVVQDTQANITAGADTISAFGASATLAGTVSVAEADATISAGSGAGYVLADTAANLALASVAVMQYATSVTATTTATAEQAEQIQATLSAANGAVSSTSAGAAITTAANLTLNVSDTATELATNYTADTVDADSVSSSESLNAAEATALTVTNAIGGASYVLADTAGALSALSAAGAGGATGTAVLADASSVEISGTSNDVADAQTVYDWATTKLAAGYTISGSHTDLTASANSDATDNAGAITVSGTIDVSEALEIEALNNSGVNSYALTDTALLLMGANGTVIANTSAVDVTGSTAMTVTQFNTLYTSYGASVLAITGNTVDDTAANLMILNAAAATELGAAGINLAGSTLTVAQAKTLYDTFGATLNLANVVVSDTVAALTAAIADTDTLAVLDAIQNGTGTIAVDSDGGTLAQIKAIEGALNSTALDTVHLTDTADNLGDAAADTGSAEEAIIAAASSITVSTAANIAQLTDIDADASLTAGSTLVYSVADVAAAIATDVDTGGADFSGSATSVDVTTAATASFATVINGMTTVPTIAIDDTYAEILGVGSNLTDAMLDAASTVTLTDTMSNIATNATAITADASVDTVVIEDFLGALASAGDSIIAADALAAADSVTITYTGTSGTTAISTTDAADVNAVADVATVSYTLSDTYGNMISSGAAANTAIGTMIAGAATINVATGGTMTVSEFNVLDALTTAAITGNVSDTIAELSNLTTAAAAIDAATTVTVSDEATVAATAAQFNQMVANGISAAELANVDITDTAAGIAELSDASWTVILKTQATNGSDTTDVNVITVSDNGALTLSVAQADAIYDYDGGTSNGSAYGNYTISDTAENIANANSGLINAAQSATVITAATNAQAATIAGLETFGGAIAYDIEDADLTGASTSGLNGATNITITGALDLADATTVSNASNSGTSTYSIQDAAAIIGANSVGTGSVVTSLSTNAVSAVEGASSVTTVYSGATAATADEAVALAAFTNTVTYDVSDTSANAITYSGGLADAADITITGDVATAENANTIMAADNSGSTTIAAVTDAVANLNTLSIGSNDVITTVTGSSGTVTAAEVNALRALDTGTNIGSLDTSAVNVTDTYSALSGMSTLSGLGTVTVSKAVTMAEAISLGADAYTAITDTFAGIMDDTNVDAAPTGASHVGNNTVVTVSDSITIAQAIQLAAVNSSNSSMVYNIVDNDANIISEYNDGGTGEAAMAAASSITDANGNAISLVSLSTVAHISATIADMANYSSVITADANHLLYEVAVADLVADSSFVPGLPTTHDFRVTDTAENLGTNNAQLLQADLVVISDSVSLAEYDAINGFVTTVTVTPTTLTDTAEVLAGDTTTVGATSTAVVATTAATVAQATSIAGATAVASYSIEDAGANFTATSAVDAYDEATNITVTGTGATDGIATNVAVTLMGATNSGTTTIAEIRDTAGNLTNATTGVAANVGSNDTITAIVATSGTMSVDEASDLMGVASDVTFSLSDTAENLAAASSSVLNAATDITATGDTTVAQAAVIDAATNDGSNTYSIADTAENILTASTSLLETDANQEVEVTDTSVTAAIATQLGTLDSDNDDDTTTTSVTEGFSVHADGVATAGEFAIEDAQANVVATANSAAVTAASAVTLSDAALTAAQVAAADTAGDLVAGYNMSDTYANLALTQGTVGGSTVLFANTAANVTITNNLSTSQATSADSWTNTGTLTFNVRDIATRIATDQAASSVTDNAAQVTVSTAASAAEAAYISEMSNIVGGYAISDKAVNIASALSTANAADTADRETVIGATSVTVTTNATVAEAAGVATEASEAYGIYNVSGISYNVEDTVENLVTGSSSTDAAALTGATTVYLKTDGDMTVAQADVVTAFSNFGAYDSNQADDTAGIYNIVDGFAAVQVADASLLSGAAAVTANGTGGSASTADTMNMSVLNVGATIDGMDGDDIITGTDYGDTIVGGAGADTLTGGLGADTFVIAADAIDVILDLTAADDFISTGTAAATYEAITDSDGTIASAANEAAAVAAAFVLANGGNDAGIEAIGFVYGSNNYIAVEATASGDETGAFVANVDDLTGLAAANFIV